MQGVEGFFFGCVHLWRRFLLEEDFPPDRSKMIRLPIFISGKCPSWTLEITSISMGTNKQPAKM